MVQLILLDYLKTCDFIRRGKRIDALMHNKIHYKIIEKVANIYQHDYTEVKFGEIMK